MKPVVEMHSPLNIALLRSVRLMLLLILSCIVALFLLSISPLDPLIQYSNGNLLSISTSQQALMTQELGLDKGFWVQLSQYVSQLAQGDLGASLIYRQPVTEVIAERLPLSMLLMASSWLLALIIGYVLGVIAGLKCNSTWDKLISRCAWTIVSLPSFWVAMLCISFFSVSLAITPVCCAAPLGMAFSQQSVGSMLAHLALPVFVLSLKQIAPLVLHTREKIIDISATDYVRYAVMHRQSRAAIFWQHIFKNSLQPILILHFASFSELFGGSILAETVFNFPGLGNALVKAGLGNDASLLMGITLFSAIFVFFGNLIAELIVAKLHKGTKVAQ